MLFLIPAVCFVITVIYGLTDEGWKHRIWLPSGIILTTEYAILFLLHVLLAHESVSLVSAVPVLPVLLLSALPYGILLTGNQVRHVLKRVCMVSLALFLAELFILNGKSLTTQYQERLYLPSDIEVSDTVVLEDECLTFSGNAVLTLRDVPSYAYGMTFSVEQVNESNDPIPFYVKLTMYDDNFPQSGIVVQEKMQVGRASECRLSFQPYGTIHTLRIDLSGISQPMKLQGITIASNLSFRFQQLRFWLLWTVLTAVVLIVTCKLYRVRYHRNNKRHLLCIGVAIALCMGICSGFVKPNDEPYPYENSASSADPYALTFDAFEKGQVWLDLEPDAILETMDNVYCIEERNNSDAFYFWDYAYYQGKYYCYFGVTPVLLYYFPHYWLTGQLPTVSMAVNFFAVWSVLFFALALLAAVRLFDLHPNLLLLMLSIAAVSFSVGAYHMMGYAGVYHLPMAAGLCMLSLCLWAGISACTKRKMPIRMLLLFISGAALALCVGARQPMALSAAVLIPLFIGILLNKRQRIGWRLSQAVSFLVPLSIGVAGLLYYNQLRFGSLFDFGSTYQLTVSDVNANQVQLTNLWGAIEHYFVMPPRTRTTFPFFEPQFGQINNYQHYVYREGTVGWLSYLMVPVGMLCLYPALARDKARYHSGIRRIERNWFLLICFIMPVVIAWLDFSAGGINQRYLYDLAPLLFMGCTIAILSVSRKISANRYGYGLLCMTVIATNIFAALLLIEIPDSNFQKASAWVYNAVEEMVMFWQ